MYTELAPKIYFVEGENRGNYPYSNSLLIDDKKKVLIDTGTGTGRNRQIAHDFNIDLVLMSHAHEDHIAGNPVFPGAKIAAHKNTAPAIRRVQKIVEQCGVKGTDAEKLIYDLFNNFYQLGDSRVDLEFEDGEYFNLGNHELIAIHTPGHSAGHCCFNLPTAGLIFLSDIELSSFGPYYGNEDSDINSFLESIERVKKLSYETAVSAHKGIFCGRDHILDNLDRYRDIIFERESTLLKFLERERTIDEIVDQSIICDTSLQPKALFKIVEIIMVRKHLELMLNKNLVTVSSGHYIKAD